ncbi:MAG: hemin uptake protein HemP [Acidovorax sp.]
MPAEDEALTAAVPRFDDVQLRASSLDSASLLRGHKTVQILHNGSIYTLQATKLGKLILTK